MLSKEIRGIDYQKAEHRRQLKRKLNNRSDGSIEFKHQNISAVLLQLGMPYITGYKPRVNYQQMLAAAVLDFLRKHDFWQQDFEYFASAPVTEVKAVDFEQWLQPMPELMPSLEPEVAYQAGIAKVDYLAKEQANKILGDRGEELVMQYERWRLLQEDKAALADTIEWISREQGDGAGFDILSKNTNGTDRYIEVKTTQLGKYTPIYLTRNELAFSRKEESNYFLYRVFACKKDPKMFNARGRLDSICQLEPVHYLGRFK